MAQLRPAGEPGSKRAFVYHIIFEHGDGWSRRFDVVLIIAILASVLAVMLESVPEIGRDYGTALRVVEWFFTILFTIEYVVRLWAARPARAYATSPYGVIDLLAVAPTYLSLFMPGGQFLAVIRVLRVIRVFRVLKLVRYVGEASVLGAALRASRYKISVFLVAVLSLVVVVGAAMYVVEGPENGFTSIPKGVYWAIVTLTTVGYGDIAPNTAAGQALAAFVMILGYGVIAVPTGIVTAELTNQPRQNEDHPGRKCPGCHLPEPDDSAAYCRWCGTELTNG